MVQLLDSDIKTREVLDWKGVHVLHFAGSSCSQKLRVFLNLKGIPWESHPSTCLATRISGRGSSASIRAGWCRCWCTTARCTSRATTSSSISRRRFPTPKLIPAGHENEVAALLKHEDDLHLDLRTLSFRFVFAPPGPPKPAEALESYAAQRLRHRARRKPIATSRSRSSSGSAPPAKASPTNGPAPRRRNSAPSSTRSTGRLAQQPYLMGEALSVLDIAWLIYAHRLSLAGYPFARLHPHVDAWREQAVGAAGIRQGDRDGAPLARATRRHPPRPGAGRQDPGGGRRVLAVLGSARTLRSFPRKRESSLKSFDSSPLASGESDFGSTRTRSVLNSCRAGTLIRRASFVHGARARDTAQRVRGMPDRSCESSNARIAGSRSISRTPAAKAAGCGSAICRRRPRSRRSRMRRRRLAGAGGARGPLPLLRQCPARASATGWCRPTARAVLRGLPPQPHDPRSVDAGESRALAQDRGRQAPAVLHAAEVSAAARHQGRGSGRRWRSTSSPIRPARTVTSR